MRLPNAGRAIVDAAKVRDYLLSESHPIGRFKSVFFRSLGHTPARWKDLASALRQVAETGEAELDEPTAYGQKYRVSGSLPDARGDEAGVLTVGIVLHDEDAPRFVTAFPGEAR